MRDASGDYWNPETKKYEHMVGKFHQWAQKYQEFESGPGNYTVALIEDIYGHVWECEPNTVRFLS